MPLPLFPLTHRADTKKLNLVRHDPIACRFSNFDGHLIKEFHVRIDDSFTLRTYDMRMWIGFVTIVTVASIRKPDFENLTDGLEEVNRLVDCRQAGGREIHQDLFVDLFDTWMFITTQKDLYDGNSLRSNAKLTLTELAKDFIQPILWTFHVYTVPERPLMENNSQQRITNTLGYVNILYNL